MAVPPFRISEHPFTTTPVDPVWGDAVYGQSIEVWVAIRQGAGADEVARSDDGGVTWTFHSLPNGGNWHTLFWSEDAELFVAGCTNNSIGTIATSPDGITWTNVHPERSNISSYAYGAGQFVGVGGQRQVTTINVLGKANFALAGLGVFTRTVNFNMSVSNVLFAGIVGNTTDNLTSVTYNGVAMTLVEKVQNGSDRWIYVYKLLAPTTGGTFPLTLTFSASNQGSAIYFMGYSNGGDVLQSTTDTGTGTVISTSLTTTYDESWLAQFSVNDVDGTGTNGTVGVVRQTTDGQGGTWADSNSTIAGIPQLTPPGLYSIDVNVPSSNWAAITIAFRPQVTEGFINSADGSTWLESESPNATLRGVVRGPDRFVAVGARFPGAASYTSADGNTWAEFLGAPDSPDLSSSGSCTIVYADDLDLYVYVGDAGGVFTSPDGETWDTMTPSADPNAGQILGVTWAKRLGLLIFFGEGDEFGTKPIHFSEDGLTIETDDWNPSEDMELTCGKYSPIDDKLIMFNEFGSSMVVVTFGPTIIEVDPPSGDIVGGNTVNIIGAGFLAGVEVVFDNLFATDVVVVNENLITCVVPSHDLGFVDVTVTNPDDRFDIGENLYEYATDTSGDEPGGSGKTPQIGLLGVGCAPGSIDPASGPILGGTPVTIYGQGFRAGSTVLFGGVPATSVVIDTVQPYPGLVNALNPEAYWRLEEASAATTLQDQTANNNDITAPADGKTSVQGALTDSSKGFDLAAGSKGFDLDGSFSAQATVTLSIFNAAGTIEFWIRPRAGGPFYGGILGDGDFNNGIYIIDNGSSIRVAYESDENGFVDQFMTTSLTAGQLYHVALVLDGLGGGEWFLNGVSDGTITDVNLFGSDIISIFDIDFSYSLDCELLDEIAIYDTELTSVQLLAHATGNDLGYPALVMGDGAIAYWRCEEADAATTLEDSSGNGVDGNLTVGGRTSVPGALDDSHDTSTIAGISLSGSYSIEFWIRPRAGSAVQAILVDASDLGFYLDATGRLIAEQAHVVQTDMTLTPGTLYHCVFVANGSTGAWIINDVDHTDVGAGDDWDATDDATYTQMFGDSTGNPLEASLIDEFAIYNVALTAPQITAHFEAATEWESGTFLTCVTPAHQSGEVDVEIVEP